MFSDTRCPLFHRKTSFEGYTLLEVLIATAIFSSMVLLATMALNQGLRQYQGLMEKGVNFWANARYLWIDKSFNSVIDYHVNNGERWFPYFEGDQEGFSFVTLSPLAGDLPVVVWIRNERQDDGKRSLVYYELPVYTKTFQEIARDYSFGDYKKGYSVKLLENVENIEIGYYGYDMARQQALWSADYGGDKKMTLPSLVKISYTDDRKSNTLAFGVNVNSTMKMTYDEIYPLH